MFKFRSMTAGCDSRLAKEVRDPRLTRFGHSLRRFSVDEIPQMLNVVRGDMALVGPRPEIPRLLKQYREGDFHRFDVHPGVTGLWQISGRSKLSLEEKIRLDLEYIDSHSAWNDFKIIARTPGAVLRGRGAW
jgi:lipopolysaccharide/colanic/teichoic acid biosynthesis glycosyltransferase